MASTEEAAHRRSAVTSPLLGRWAIRSFARDAAEFLGQSMLFAGSVSCMVGVVVVLLKLF
jgi:hypothetical protein